MNSEVFEAMDLSELRVLVVDDEADIRLGLKILLDTIGIQAVQAADGREALDLFRQAPFDLVLTDLMMPGLTGAELLVEVKKIKPEAAVVVLTGFGSVHSAVQCMQDGASHFLTKPFENAEVVRLVRRLGCQLLAQRSEPQTGVQVIAEDPATLRMLDLVRRVAPRPVPVMIEGESGAGKEVIARALYQWSSVNEGPFLAVNCAALPDTLLESELFGHRRGAFTGADRDRTGVFVQAQGGTVFLDEVASMSPAFQGKLLRVLQEKVVRPVGSDLDVPVNFRLIAATNRDLEALAKRGEFREDLFFRLMVVRVHIPPLRQRPQDILPLALHFLRSQCRACLGPGTPTPEFAGETIQRLLEYQWPGNVRELENVIQRALITCCGDRILPYHLGLDENGWKAVLSQTEVDDQDQSYADAKRRSLEAFQREFVSRALEASQGNVSQAAIKCGLTRAAFQKILRQLEIDREAFVPHD
jgi:DNA-binding NtrC family response regulator